MQLAYPAVVLEQALQAQTSIMTTQMTQALGARAILVVLQAAAVVVELLRGWMRRADQAPRLQRKRNRKAQPPARRQRSCSKRRLLSNGFHCFRAAQPAQKAQSRSPAGAVAEAAELAPTILLAWQCCASAAQRWGPSLAARRLGLRFAMQWRAYPPRLYNGAAGGCWDGIAWWMRSLTPC